MGLLFSFLYRVKKYNFFLLADTAVGGLVLGQIIGRYGNFFNREAFGEYTNSLFAMRLRVDQVNPANITELMRSHMTTVDGVQYIQVHPTFLYESLWNILVLVLILVFTTKKKFNGEIFLLYLVGYALGRVWIEGLRTDQLQIGSTGIAVSQVGGSKWNQYETVVSMGSGIVYSADGIIVGVVVWICVRRKIGKKILTV